MRHGLNGALLTMALAASLSACGDDKKKDTTKPASGGGDKAAPAGSGAKYDASKSKASVKGTVKWTGTKPAPVFLPAMSSDKFCQDHTSGKQVPNDRFVVAADGGLPNAFVWAFEGPHKGMSGFAAPAPAVLDQVGCVYVPHVFGLLTGQTLTIKNSDKTSHNVHFRPKTNKNENIAQSPGAKNDVVFASKEVAIPINCDTHTWMSAVTFVVDHPFFATTDASGNFEVKGLPAGDYTFKVWHEGLSGNVEKHQQEFKVTVKDGETVTHNVDMTETSK